MKKIFLGFAIAAISMISLTAAAQSPATITTNPTAKECTVGKAKGPQRSKADLFAGMNLTDNQKAKLAELNEKSAQQRSETKKAAKEAKANARKAARKQYLADVKAIIGADNYVVFLENMVINGQSGKKALGQSKAKRKGAKPMGKRRGAPKQPQDQTNPQGKAN